MPTTSYMSLSLPTVSVSVGPAWASQLNAALTAVDAHDHTSGSGKPVRAGALSIDADVAFGGFNLTGLRSLRLANQGAALALGTDLGCVFESGGDLFWNNASGQHVQITSGAALNAASIGAIGGDYATSTASEFYTAASTTFSFLSASNKYANIEVGNVIIRQPGVTSPKGITLESPAALAADYSLTLPATLPGSTLPMLVSNTGIMSTGAITAAQTDGSFAPLASPTFTGTVTVPTPVNPTDAATQAYVKTAWAWDGTGGFNLDSHWAFAVGQSNYTIRLARIGGGYLGVVVVHAVAVLGATTLMGNLAAGFRPSSPITVVGANSGVLEVFVIAANGNVSCSSAVAGHDYYFTVTFWMSA